MPFVVPDDAELSQFHVTVNPMFKRILNNQIENDTLCDIRDTLLPRLMTGEIDVSKVEV